MSAPLALLCLIACHAAPSLDGAPLECQGDDDCTAHGSPWRCYQGLCVRNGVPSVDPLPVIYASPQDVVAHTATGDDPEGDPLIFSWSALAGPAEKLAMSWPYVAARLSFTAVDVGVYRFAVVANDSYSTSPEQIFTVVVSPVPGAVYVSTAGEDRPECAAAQVACCTYDEPCASIAAAAAELPPSGGTVLLAAMSGPEPYRECLNLTGEVTVLGCFDPETWEYDAAARPLCRLECDDAGGHHLSGNAALVEIALAMSPSLWAAGSSCAPGDPPRTTLWIANGGPPLALQTVDIEAAARGAGCTAVGLATTSGTATLIDVHVRGASLGYDPVQNFAGMVLASPVTVSGGSVVMSAPVIHNAIGVLGMAATVQIEAGFVVAGGTGRSLYGIVGLDSALAISAARVDLIGLGTRDLMGIAGLSCIDENPRGLCTCAAWLGAICSTLAPPATPTFVVVASEVSVLGASEELGLAPCSAIGVGADSSKTAITIDGTSIQVGRNITLAVGLLAAASAIDPLLTHTLTDNAIAIGQARIDSLCAQLNTDLGFEDFTAGSVGTAVVNAAGALVARNTITVEASEWLTIGLVLEDDDGVLAADNLVTVGAAEAGLWSWNTMGAWLAGNRDLNNPSYFYRNQVRVADPPLAGGNQMGGAIIGAAALLEAIYDPQQPRYPSWELSNNFFFGGRVLYSSGLTALITFTSDPLWPAVRHNTIHAGGDAGYGLVSVALRSVMYDYRREQDADCGGTCQDATGVFANNLLDAGDANGIKRLLDNNWAFFAQGGGNLAQLHTVSAGQQPWFVAPLPSLIEVNGISGTVQWHVLMAGTGDLLPILDKRTGELAANEAGRKPFFGRPLAAWYGTAGGAPVIAVATALGISTAPANPSYLADFTLSSPGGPCVHTPTALALADGDDAAPADVLFTETPYCGGDAGLWLMRGRSPQEGGGYRAAEWVRLVDQNGGDVVVTSPSLLVVSQQTGRLAMVDHNAGAQAVYVRMLVSANEPRAQTTVLNLPNVTQVSAVELTKLDGASSDATDDVVAIADGQVRVLLAVDPKSGDGTLASFGLPAPCAASTATHIAVGDALPETVGNEVVVACSNNAIEVFTLWGNTLTRAGVQPGPSPIIALAVGEPRRSSAMGQPAEGRVLVARGSTPSQIEVWEPATWARTGPLVLAGDAAMLDWTTQEWVVSFAPLNGVPGIGLRTPAQPQCDLSLRTADDYDLHLTGGPCVDAGSVIPGFTDDIDGCGARPDVNSLDIGADEVGQSGTPCDSGT